MDLERRAAPAGTSCSGTYSLAGVRVVEHGVTVAEGAALDVLAGQPDRDAVGEDAWQSASSSAVAQSIVRSVGLSSTRLAPLAAALELPVKREALGRRQQRVVDRAQPLERHAGLRRARPRPAGAGSGTGGT